MVAVTIPTPAPTVYTIISLQVQSNLAGSSPYLAYVRFLWIGDLLTLHGLFCGMHVVLPLYTFQVQNAYSCI